MSQRDIERLRALEIELRNEAEAKQLESQDKNWSEWVRDRAHGRSAGLHEAANRIQQLIAELGQGVGAVAPVAYRKMVNTIGGPYWEFSTVFNAEHAISTGTTGYEPLYPSPAHTSEERDAQRLDWIERTVTEKAAVWLLPSADHRFVQVRWSRGDVDNSPTASNIREAIDAAMRQEAGDA